MQKIAFAASYYTDCDFTSGGVKLNFMLLKQLKQTEDCLIHLYCDNIKNNTSGILDETYPLENLENNKEEYDIIMSEKGLVPSNITYIHDHSYPYRTEMMSNEVLHFFYKIFNYKKHKKRLDEYKKIKENLSKTEKIIVSSTVLKNDMIINYGISPDKIIILPPPVEKYNIYTYKNRIFTFGISAIGFNRKGGYEVFKAIKELKKSHKNFKVQFIYPSKNLFVKLANFLNGAGKYCEFIPVQKDMGKFYNSIDCLLMPSLIEPFGMVATEAMSTGCPVITAIHCGACDLIQNGKNGYTYNGKPKELAKVMSSIINTKLNNYYKMCRNSISSVENLSEQNFVSKYFEIIETLR